MLTQFSKVPGYYGRLMAITLSDTVLMEGYFLYRLSSHKVLDATIVAEPCHYNYLSGVEFQKNSS